MYIYTYLADTADHLKPTAHTLITALDKTDPFHSHPEPTGQDPPGKVVLTL